MKQICLLFLFLFASVATAQCPNVYNDSIPPFVETTDAVEVCFQQYAVLYSTSFRSAIYSAEKVTKESVALAKGLLRINAFHTHKQFKPSQTTTLFDYVNSNFDRGHLAPFGDMSTKQAGYESFDLINIVPQNPRNNKHMWKNIEKEVRNLASRVGVVYVITGPIYGKPVAMLNSRVPIPKYLFKAIYVPSTGESEVIIAENSDTDRFTVVSLSKFESATGIDLFPSIAPIKKLSAIQLIQIRLQ